jgi:adenylate cyclase
MFQGEQKRSACIMSTNISDWVDAIEKSEALGMQLADENARLHQEILGRHNGRLVKRTGDGHLAEFGNALDCVQCAIEIQKALHERNLHMPTERMINLRIGIHCAEAVSHGGDVFGAAVNIASRLMNLDLVRPAGICFTERIHDQVHDKLKEATSYLGKQQLKNVTTPIDVYRVILPWA